MKAFRVIFVFVYVLFSYAFAFSGPLTLIKTADKDVVTMGDTINYCITANPQYVTPKADIIWVIDRSGSMSYGIDNILANIQYMTGQLSGRKIDYRLGLLTYVDGYFDSYGFAENDNKFKTWLDGIPVGGGIEEGLEALYEANKFPWRSDASRTMILITDEGVPCAEAVGGSSPLYMSTTAHDLFSQGVIIHSISKSMEEYGKCNPIYLPPMAGGIWLDYNAPAENWNIFLEILGEAIATMSNVVIRDPLPPQLEPVPGTYGSALVDGNELIWTFDEIDRGTPWQICFQAFVKAEFTGVLDNIATGSADGIPETESNNVYVVKATPTVTPTYTNTPTFTATPTFTPTRTVTPTFTVTLTATPTVTLTDTVTPSITATFTPTPTVTPTATPTFTVTGTYTATATPTYTPTPTATLSATESSTLTQTRSATPTVTSTPTVTYTVSETVTLSATDTRTATASPSFTLTLTPTFTQTPTFTDTPGATFTASPTVTNTPVKTFGSYDMLAPASVIAGEPFWVTLTVYAGFEYGAGVIADNYDGTSVFTSGAPSATLPADYAFVPALDAGVHVFQAVLRQAGTAVLTAADSLVPALTDSAVITVNAAPAMNFTILAPSEADAGEAFWVTIQAKDSFNNIVADYTGTAGLTSTDPANQYLGDAQFAAADNGVKYLLVTLYTAGSHRIYAEDTLQPAIHGTSNEIFVKPGALAGFLVAAPSVVNANTTFTFGVTARDAYNNVITDYNGTVHFVSDDGSPAVVLPQDYTYISADSGVRLFQAVLQSAGIRHITVSDTAAAGVNGVSGDINVVVPAVSYVRPLLLTSYLTQPNDYQFVYLRMDDRVHTFSSNEFLEYDVYVPDYSSNFYCSMEFQNGNFGDMRDYGQATQNYIRDQNAIRIHPSMDISQYAKGNWYRRKFDVSMLSGYYYGGAYLSQDTGNIGFNGAPSNLAGTFNAFYDNITYKNPGGTIVHNVFSNDQVMRVGAAPYIVRSTINTAGSWRSTTTYPRDNYIWVIDGWKAWASAASAPADGVTAITIQAYVWAPDVGTNTKVSGAIIDFKSDRGADIVEPAAVSLNTYAITDSNGNARAYIRSQKAGAANVTLRFGPFSRIVTVNFTALGAHKTVIEPAVISSQTNVAAAIRVLLADINSNQVSDARGITLTSDSVTAQFSYDNGATWVSEAYFSGAVQRNILVRDSTPGQIIITAAAPGLVSAQSVMNVNDLPAVSLSVEPGSASLAAGVLASFTIRAKDSGGGNANSNASVRLSSNSASSLFSADNLNWYGSINVSLAQGAAVFYFKDTSAQSGAVITASDNAAVLSDGYASVNISASSPAILTAWSNIYSVAAGQWVTITAKVTDAYGNPVNNKWISFTQMVQGGKTQNALVTPAGNSTNASGLVTAWFRVSSDPTGSMNYCVASSEGLLGATVTISASGSAVRLAFLPAPMALGAGKTGTLFINAKDINGYNSPAPSGHESVHVYANVTYVAFSQDGTNWYKSVTPVLDASGAASVKVRCFSEGTYFPLTAYDLNTGAGHLESGTNTLTVTTGYYVKVYPDAPLSGPAGSLVNITARVTDQNGNFVPMQGVKTVFSTDEGSISAFETITDSQGAASVMLRLSLVAGTVHKVKAVIENPDDASYSAAITSEEIVSFSVSAPSLAYTGIPVNVTVRAKNSFGATVTGFTGTVEFSSNDPAAILQGSYIFTPADAGIKIIQVIFNTTGLRSVTAMETGNPAGAGTSNNVLVSDAPTPTPTFTATRTITPTITETSTPTFTTTVTPTVTQTVTPTGTPSATATYTATPTFTATPSATQTVTETATPTVTATATMTHTYTTTLTATLTATDSATPTVTPTLTVTETATMTATETFTNTPEDTYTVTETMVVTDTPEASPTPSATATPSEFVTDTHTPSATATFTVSDTPTCTATETFTVTPTHSDTPTPSVTPTATGTFTEVHSPTVTRTFTVTRTHTLSPTVTNTMIPQDSYENDDTWQQAKPIQPWEVQVHNIVPWDDADWVVFTLNAASLVTIEASGIAADTEMWLYSAAGVSAGTHLNYDDDGGEGAFSKISQFLDAGVYYVKVQEYGQNSLIPSYELKLSVLGPDSYENDNLYTDASWIYPGQNQIHSVFPATDSDWVKFEVTSQSVVTLECSGASGDTVMYLYNEFGVPSSYIYYDNDGGAGYFSKITAQLPPGVYYARITENGMNAVIENYTISLSVSPSTPTATPTVLTQDQYENDDVYTLAAQIMSGAAQQHSIHVPSDADWVYFEVGQYSSVNISTSGLSGDTVIYLYNQAGVPSTYMAIDYNSGIGNFSSITANLNPGIYYVRITENGMNAVINSYFVEVTITPILPTPTVTPVVGDDYETDNFYYQAKEISAGETQQRSFHLASDTDWVKFILTEESQVVLTASGPLGDAEMYLYDSIGVPSAQIAYDNDSGPGLFPMITLQLGPGVYYARLNENGMNSTINQYSLNLSVTALTPTPTATVSQQDGYEPDDTHETASWIYHGFQQAHTLHDSSDTDWLKFTIGDDSTVVITTSGASGGTQLWLYSETGVPLTPVAFDDNSGTGDFSMISSLLSAGTYYVRITSDPSYPGTAYLVSIDVSDNTPTPTHTITPTFTATIPAGDIYEPDNTYLQASTITSGMVQNHSIGVSGDNDWVVFTVAVNSMVVLETSGTSDDTELFLYTAAGAASGSYSYYDDDGGTGLCSKITVNLAPGTYYARARSYGNYGIIPSYQLSLIIVPLETMTPTQTPPYTATPTFTVTLTPSETVVATSTPTYTQTITINEAVDNFAITFTTDGNSLWAGIADATAAGSDSAGSGYVGNNMQSNLMITLAGPGELKFFWKVSSEPAADTLSLWVNGIKVNEISGEQTWTEVTQMLGSGNNNIRWQYAKNASGTSGADAGFVDAVSFDFMTPTATPEMSHTSTPSTTVTSTPTISIPEAVDNLQLVFNTFGNVLWRGQDAVYHSGNDAAESGAVSDGGSSYLETTLTGPGYLSFFWNVSSQAGSDYLRFIVDGTVQSSITGSPGWAQVNYNIPAGQHLIRWVYVKDASGSDGADRGWVDLITYAEYTKTPTPTSTVYVTHTQTATASATRTSTPTRTNTLTSTETPFVTATPTFTISQTYTITMTPTITPTGGVWVPSGLWHQVPDSAAPSSKPNYSGNAWYYGIDATLTYNTGAANSGSLTSGVFANLPAGTVMTFSSWEQTENYAGYDTRRVYVSADNGVTWNMVLNSTGPENTWHTKGVNLFAYTGQNIRIRFEFNTVDGVSNAFRGWYVDDITFVYPTPTSTRTSTDTPVQTETATPTVTPTVTSTVTETVTETPTVTQTHTITETHTVSPTFTVTSTITETSTITQTYTITETHTVSPTVTDTSTPTPTSTATPTDTITPDYTATATDTMTSTITQTGTHTPTFTATPSATMTPTATPTGVWTANGLWHQVPDTAAPTGKPNYTGSAWYYGQDATLTYNTGTANSGYITSPVFANIPAGTFMTFSSWEQTENSGNYDTRRVYVSANGGASWSQVWASAGPENVWRTVTVNLAAFAGQNIIFRFEFNTVDAVLNDYRGWYVDDVTLIYPTPTVTRTWTVVQTATHTVTPTATPSVTPTYTLSATRTVTETSTITQTHSITETHTVSPTFTDTPTITETATITETHTNTETHTVSPTVTETSTATPTDTITPDYTATPTYTVSRTVSATASPTSTFTITIPPTLTATATPTGVWTAGGLWHQVPDTAAPSGKPNYSGTAWYYGIDATLTYNNGGANSGSVTGPVFANIPAGTVMTFSSWEQTENFGSYDTRKVFVSVNGGAAWSQVWASTGPENVWRTVSVSLAAFAGQNIMFRFEFDTIDGFANDYRGWYVDDITLVYPTPTATRTMTATETIAQSPSVTNTNTPTITGTPPTATVTQTVTATITGTPPTATNTPTATATASPTMLPGTGMTWQLVTDPAGFGAIYGHSSAVHGGKIWVIGGYAPASAGISNDIWSSPDGENWSMEAANPAFSDRFFHSSVSFNGRLWVIGGSGSMSVYNDVWSSADGMNWVLETANAGFSPRYWHTSLVFGGKIWVIGGINDIGNTMNDVWNSSDGVNWNQVTLSAAFGARMGLSAAVHGGKIWVSNGFDGMTGYNDIWNSTDGVNWIQSGPVPYSPRYSNTLLSYGGRLWMIGGFETLSYTPINDVWYSEDGTSWTAATYSAEFTPRAGHCSEVFNNRLWVIAGYLGGPAAADVWRSPPDIATPTPTVTPTGTIFQSPSVTNTVTPTITGTPPTATVTQTVTPTITGTPPTATITQTVTPTITGTPPTATATQTVTPTITGTPPTATVTQTVTPTITGTPPTATMTYTISPTQTNIPPVYTHTPTAVPTLSYPGDDYAYVYPQPAKDKVTVVFGVNDDSPVKVVLYNAAGMDVAIYGLYAYQGQVNKAQFDITKFAPGTYFCVIKQEETSWAKQRRPVKFLVVK